jgi:hypothetical protein
LPPAACATWRCGASHEGRANPEGTYADKICMTKRAKPFTATAAGKGR